MVRRRSHDRATEALRGLSGDHDRHSVGILDPDQRQSQRLGHDGLGSHAMSKKRKAGLTVSLLFVGPLLLCAWILIVSRDQHPSTPVEQAAIAADLQNARDAREAPVVTDMSGDP